MSGSAGTRAAGGVEVAPRLGWGVAAVYAALIALAVALVFGSALSHSFLLGHDDAEYVAGPLVRAPFLAAVIGAFKARPLGAWAPLHLIAVRIDRALWGDWAGGYVLGNLVLHALGALLTAWLVVRAGGPRLAAAVAGLVFAVHPVQVEAVVWISQTKTLLAAVFLLASLHAWISYAEAAPERKARWSLLALAAGACALLSKPVSVVLPLAIALLDLALGRLKLSRSWLVEKAPFVAMALAIAVVTVAGKTEALSLASETGHDRTVLGPFAWYGGGPLGTFFTMATVLPRYLRLLLWPVDLSAVYTPEIHARFDPAVAASCALIALLLAAGVLLLRRSPRLFCWTALFFVGLLPVSQIVPQVTLMNDRYLYLPMVGAAALAGEAVAAALQWSPATLRPGVLGLAALVAGVLAAQARARVPVWRSDLLLWDDAVRKAPRSPHAWYNFGRAMEASLNDEDALACYLKALALDASDGDSATNAGAISLRFSRLDAAAPLVEDGARLLPASEEAQFNLALLRFDQGRIDEAEAPLRFVLGRDGANCAAEALLGHVLTLTGRPLEALDRYRSAAAHGCADPEVTLYQAYAESQRSGPEAALPTLGKAVTAAAKKGIGYLDRNTLKPLKAQPGFDALLKLYAQEQARVRE